MFITIRPNLWEIKTRSERVVFEFFELCSREIRFMRIFRIDLIVNSIIFKNYVIRIDKLRLRRGNRVVYYKFVKNINKKVFLFTNGNAEFNKKVVHRDLNAQCNSEIEFVILFLNKIRL